MSFYVCAFELLFSNNRYFVAILTDMEAVCQKAIKGLSEAALKTVEQKFHYRKIIAPATLWANKMTFPIRAFKSLFSDTFEHDEKDDEAPLI